MTLSADHLSNGKFRNLFGVSLFTGAGIGDIGFRAAGVKFLATCEIEHDRAALAKLNFPEAVHFQRDIREVQADLCESVRKQLSDREELFLISCTAPCQGMSKNGQGTLLANIRKGKRPSLDPRNRLILPALDVIKELRPLWVVFENVLEMRNTVIEDSDGNLRPILKIIETELGSVYRGQAYDVECADYRVPQRRQRLITIFTRDETAKARFKAGLPFVVRPTHAKHPSKELKQWVSVGEALRGFPRLDAATREEAFSKENPFHHVPVLDPKKYEWLRHTPPSGSAFDNQCVNPKCQFDQNPTHGAARGRDGINRALKDTPLYCQRCEQLLPRPYTKCADGTLRIMSGYTSAYKRMNFDLPAPTLTRNLSYPCSDQKVHFVENRVLSLWEAMTLHTITEYDYKWGPLELIKGARKVQHDTAPDGLVRLVIAESVPPRFLQMQGEYLMALSFEHRLPELIGAQPAQGSLW